MHIKPVLRSLWGWKMKTKRLKEKNEACCKIQFTGVVDIKKYRASSHCHLYDVTVYRRSKAHPQAGLLYPKKTLEEVKQLLSQGNFTPNVLSEQLFHKILSKQDKKKACPKAV